MPIQHKYHHVSSSSTNSCSSNLSSKNVFAPMGSLSINHPTSPAAFPGNTCWPYALAGNSASDPLCFPIENTSTTSDNHNAATSVDEWETTKSSEGSAVDCRQSLKMCARGHWRPAEDSKLKQLVALFGPQNWNLIAEKLDGRSGHNVPRSYDASPYQASHLNIKGFFHHYSSPFMLAMQQSCSPYRTTKDITDSATTPASAFGPGVSADGSSSSSSSLLAHINRDESSHFEASMEPPFIDFLGVGAI